MLPILRDASLRDAPQDEVVCESASYESCHYCAGRTSFTQRSMMRLRLAPAYSSPIGKILAPLSTSASAGSVLTSGLAGTKFTLYSESLDCLAALVAKSISFLPASGFLAPLIKAIASAELPMPSLGKLMTTS